MDRETMRFLESMREELERILIEKMAVLQSQLEVSQRAASPLEELANTQTSLQAISENMQSLITVLQNVEVSRKQDFEILRAEMQGGISKDLEAEKRSWSEEKQMEINKKRGEHSNLPAGLCLPESQYSALEARSFKPSGSPRMCLRNTVLSFGKSVPKCPSQLRQFQCQYCVCRL